MNPVTHPPPVSHRSRSDAIALACNRIATDDLAGARDIITTEYPFDPIKKASRTYTLKAMTRIFIRDGFIDRYRGTRLIFPPVLRLLSIYLPDDFPYHPHGKMTAGHMAFWELFPTIDHLHPVARGGEDIADNWFCCSMLTNSIKANWTLDELQWTLQPAGDLQVWDGMLAWFVQQAAKDTAILDHAYVRRWWAALPNTHEHRA